MAFCEATREGKMNMATASRLLLLIFVGILKFRLRAHHKQISILYKYTEGNYKQYVVSLKFLSISGIKQLLVVNAMACGASCH